MKTLDRAERTVTDNDFLIGSVWEGTGEELHTNRHAARSSMYGQRVLSGISGMLISLHAVSPDLVWSAPTCLEWSFDAPVFEGVVADVRAEYDVAGDRHVTVTSDGIARGRGVLRAGPRPVPAPLTGRRTRGRTMTSADVELMRYWLAPASPVAERIVPWPLLLLTTSGLVVRDKAVGDFHLSLNRWLRWVPLARVSVDDTMHCVVGTPDCRPSRTRPELTVVTFAVDVVSSVSGQRIGHVDWVMMCQ